MVIETTIGDITVDLFLKERPRACQNFLKLCKLKYYNFNLFHTIQRGFIAQTGGKFTEFSVPTRLFCIFQLFLFFFVDPSGAGDGGDSIWGIIEGYSKRYFEAEYLPKIRHSEPGLLSMVSSGDNMIGAQFFFTLGADLTSLDGIHCVIGQVVEGLDTLLELNEAICDEKNRPYRDVRITHTVILDDPFENPRGFREPSRSPSPSAERLRGGRIAADEEIDDSLGKTDQELAEMRQEREAQARATILEIIGDLPDAEVAPPENVLFVCKLNSITTDDDLEIIFSRFGKIKGCEVIRDRKTGDSLQYAFIEFEEQKSCEQAYFKMDNVLIDDRRIHVDFSQSVSKIQWRGKGRGLIMKDGSQSNKLDFNDYNKPIRKQENNGRPESDRRNASRPYQKNDRDDWNRRQAPRQHEKNERHGWDRRNEPRRDRQHGNRFGNQRGRSRSPNRGRPDDRDRRMSPRRDERRHDTERRDKRRSRSPDRHQSAKHKERQRSQSRSTSRDRKDKRAGHERRQSPDRDQHKARDKSRKHKSSRRDSSSSSSDHKKSSRKRSESPKRKKSSKHKKDKKRRD